MRPERLDGISNLFSIVVITELMYPELRACCKVTRNDNKKTKTCEQKKVHHINKEKNNSYNLLKKNKQELFFIINSRGTLFTHVNF